MYIYRLISMFSQSENLLKDSKTDLITMHSTEFWLGLLGTQLNR